MPKSGQDEACGSASAHEFALSRRVTTCKRQVPPLNAEQGRFDGIADIAIFSQHDFAQK
jgi:hypothetical protein